MVANIFAYFDPLPVLFSVDGPLISRAVAYKGVAVYNYPFGSRSPSFHCRCYNKAITVASYYALTMYVCTYVRAQTCACRRTLLLIT